MDVDPILINPNILTEVIGNLQGVDRACRSRWIGLAMHALFNKLGYAHDLEWQQCQLDIG